MIRHFAPYYNDSSSADLVARRGQLSGNLLLPDELNAILTLYTRVTQKSLLISETLGIEGRKLLTPEDNFVALRGFNRAYEGTRTAVEEMQLEYRNCWRSIPRSPAAWSRCRVRFSSGRERARKACAACSSATACRLWIERRTASPRRPGPRRWYLYDLDRDDVLEEPGDIVASIRSKPDTPRQCSMDEVTLVEETKAKVEKHIKNSYMKRSTCLWASSRR